MENLSPLLKQKVLEVLQQLDYCCDIAKFHYPEEIKEKGFIRIDVTDNGEGVPKELLEMDPVTDRPRFFNINISQRDGGTGLGTTEAWYAIKDAGGTISVQSEPGEGTTFVIKVPLADLED